MRKFAMSTIAAATLLVGGLTGCGTDNQAGDTGTFRSAGTEQYQVTGQRGTTGARYTGEGPITDMFTDDDRLGTRMQRNDDRRTRGYRAIDGSRLGVQNQQNKYNQGRFSGQNVQRPTNQGRYSGEIIQHPTTNQGRYTGQTVRGQNNGMTNITGQNNGQLRGSNTGHPRLTDNNGHVDSIPQQSGEQRNINDEQIERTVENMANVNDCNVVSQGDSIIIGVETDGNNRDQLENEIRQRVQQMVQGKNVYIVTDKEQVNRVRTLGDRMRNGGSEAMEEVGATFNAMINDLARAARRPFENNR